MFKFLCFGSGSSGNSYYISNGKDAIIIDAGIGVRSIKKYLLEYGIKHTQIKAILLSHDHFDHSRAAGVLSKMFNVKIHSSELVIEKLTQSYRTKIEKSDCVFLTKAKTFQVGDMLIEPFEIPHDSADNFGYSIHYDGLVFTIMTDVGEPTDIVKQHIRMSNYLVIEADYDETMLANNKRYDALLKQRIMGCHGHLSNSQTAELLYDNYHPNLTNVWLCHLSAENNKPELAKQTIVDYFGIRNIDLNSCFHLDVLKRKSPSGPWMLATDTEETDVDSQQLSINFNSLL